MPRDAQGNPRSGFARKHRADEAHSETAREEREEEREIEPKKASGEHKGKKPEKEKEEPKPEIDASPEDEGDIGDIVETHGPAHEINMKSDHAAGTHEVESIHGEKRHKKMYQDPGEAMRHAHMALGMGEPPPPQAEPAPGGAGAGDTMSMLQSMGRPSGMQGF